MEFLKTLHWAKRFLSKSLSLAQPAQCLLGADDLLQYNDACSWRGLSHTQPDCPYLQLLPRRLQLHLPTSKPLAANVKDQPTRKAERR
jgi:hypothetical protein